MDSRAYPDGVYPIKITERLRKKIFFLTDAGHILLLVWFCCVDVCHGKGIVLCIKLFVRSVFYDLCLGFFLCIYRIEFCIYLYGFFSGKIS